MSWFSLFVQNFRFLPIQCGSLPGSYSGSARQFGQLLLLNST